MARVVLILPSSTYRAPDFLDAARRLGAEVVVASEQEQTLAEVMGDRALHLPELCRPEEAAEVIVALGGVDAVLAVDEQGVVVASLAAQRLGLRHNPPEAVRLTRNKAEARAVLARAGLPQPEFRTAGPDDDVAALAREVGLPCVVKAPSLSASRGVIRADDPDAAAAAAEWVRRILADADQDPDGPIVVEAYVPGVEVAVEGLLRNGELKVLAIFDKPDPLEGPYFEETIYVTPSRLSNQMQGSIAKTSQRATEALGLVEGPVHAELRIFEDTLWVLELAARSIGGLCSRALTFGLGTSLEELILRHALGRTPGRVLRDRESAGVMMIPIPRSGVLREVAGRDDALAVQGVTGLEITATIGAHVKTLPEGDRYLGFLFSRAEKPEGAEHALREAHRRLRIEIEDAH